MATCGTCALLVHGAVAVALAALPSARARTEIPSEPVWIEAPFSAPGEGPAGGAALALALANRAPPAQAPAQTVRAARSSARRAHAAPAAPVSLARSTETALAPVPAGEPTRAGAGAAGGADLPVAGLPASPGAAREGALVGGAHGLGALATFAAHGPDLIATRAPCAGYFPADARVDLGEVQLTVQVDREGHARASTVLVESPRGEGFGFAAAACARGLRFAPAVDSAGAAVPGHAQIKLRFKRRMTT